MGWADLDDGPLLDAMAQHFEVLVTVDKNLPEQQRISDRPLAVVVLRAKTNRLADLLPIFLSLELCCRKYGPVRCTNSPKLRISCGTTTQ
jgi:hypothetical protein